MSRYPGCPRVVNTLTVPADRVLLRLGHDGRSTVLYITQPTAQTRQRLHRWARQIARHPSRLREVRPA